MATTAQDWQAWLQDTVRQGLAAKWDAEYLERFGVARQTPAQPVGTGGAAAVVPAAAPGLSPFVLLAGGAAALLGIYFLLRE